MAQHIHGRRTAATLVLANRMIATICDCGRFYGNGGLLPASIGRKVASGDLLVSTPHRAAGAYGDRSKGVIAEVRKGARFETLLDQLTTDPRLSFDEGFALYETVRTAYGIVQQ